jgi:recombination protein RecR
MLDYPPSVRRLITVLRQLPTIGPRSAERLALSLLMKQRGVALDLGECLKDAVHAVRPCPRCGFFAEGEFCDICAHPRPEPHLLCVVEQPHDVLLIERSGTFKGVYHVLGGMLSPLDGIGPEELQIPRLLDRMVKEGIQEAILAISPDVKGETTSFYLAREFRERGIRTTRPATGIAIGGSLEFADSATLAHALQDRREV